MSMLDKFRLCQCQLSGEIYLLGEGEGCELCEETMPLTPDSIRRALDFLNKERRPPKSVHEWIGVDLDGTLAHYENWVEPHEIGAPVPAMIERIKRWIDEGIVVKIFTARDDGHGGKFIREWCIKHIGVELEITCVKDHFMLELWDDRAVQIEQNTGRIIGHSTRGLK